MQYAHKYVRPMSVTDEKLYIYDPKMCSVYKIVHNVLVSCVFLLMSRYASFHGGDFVPLVPVGFLCVQFDVYISCKMM